MIILPNLKGVIDKAKAISYKILAGGSFTTYNSNSRNNIIILNSNGAISSDFNVGTGFNNQVNTIVLQPDGKILIGGIFTSYNGSLSNYIIRLNEDWTIDSDFTIGTGFNQRVNAIAVRSDGKIICVGGFTSYNGSSSSRIAQLNQNGTLDTSFIVDTGFTTINSNAFSVAIQSYDRNSDTGYYLVGGNFRAYKSDTALYFARINNSGFLDISFTGSGFYAAISGQIRAILIQPDGNIICGGEFTTYRDVSRNRIARLNADGTLDTSFTIGTGFNNWINAVALQSDNKIICGGFFTSYNGTIRNRIIRLNTDGGLDSSFTIGTGFNGAVNAIAIQSDGKIICGGSFTTYNGASCNRIARLNADGTIDSSFTGGTGFNSGVNALVIK